MGEQEQDTLPTPAFMSLCLGLPAVPIPLGSGLLKRLKRHQAGSFLLPWGSWDEPGCNCKQQLSQLRCPRDPASPCSGPGAVGATHISWRVQGVLSPATSDPVFQRGCWVGGGIHFHDVCVGGGG